MFKSGLCGKLKSANLIVQKKQSGQRVSYVISMVQKHGNIKYPLGTIHCTGNDVTFEQAVTIQMYESFDDSVMMALYEKVSDDVKLAELIKPCYELLRNNEPRQANLIFNS